LNWNSENPENFVNLPSSEQFLNMIMAEFEHVPERKIVANVGSTTSILADFKVW